MYAPHLFLMPASVDGHLGFFHFLATVNSDTVNYREHVPF